MTSEADEPLADFDPDREENDRRRAYGAAHRDDPSAVCACHTPVMEHYTSAGMWVPCELTWSGAERYALTRGASEDDG
ncbi:MAG TPA: hypothetical protein VFZ61_10340 [Polyangiales bacterium]